MKFVNKLIDKVLNILKSRKEGFEFLFYNVSGNIFTLLLNLTLPFVLNANGYGYFALVFSIFNLGAAFFTFGLNSTILKFSIENKYKKNTLLTCLTSWAILAFLFTLILLAPSYLITKYSVIDITFLSLILTLLSSAFISIQRILLSFYIGIEAKRKYGLVFVLNKLIQFAIVFLAAILVTNEMFSFILPCLLLLQSAIIVAVILFKERKLIFNGSVHMKDIHETIKFTLPLSINTFGNLGYSYGFNVLISPFLSLSQLGVLNVFTQLYSIASMTINALNIGYIPRFYKEYALNQKNAVIKYFKYILQNSTPIILMVFIAGLIYKYMTFETNEDYSIMALLVYCIGIFLYSFKSIGNNILIILGKTIKISIITVVTSVVNVIMGIVFTKFYGFLGCIISLSLGYIIQVIAFNIVSIRLYLPFMKIKRK